MCGNYSREETVWGNTVFSKEYLLSLTAPTEIKCSKTDQLLKCNMWNKSQISEELLGSISQVSCDLKWAASNCRQVIRATGILCFVLCLVFNLLTQLFWKEKKAQLTRQMSALHTQNKTLQTIKHTKYKTAPIKSILCRIYDIVCKKCKETWNGCLPLRYVGLDWTSGEIEEMRD